MWEINEYDFNIQRKTAKITDIGVDDKGPYVVLAHENWSLDYDTDIINDLLRFISSHLFVSFSHSSSSDDS